jgi:hypothetical protein
LDFTGTVFFGAALTAPTAFLATGLPDLTGEALAEDF